MRYARKAEAMRAEEDYKSIDSLLSLAKARDSFSSVVSRAADRKERVVLTRRGRSLAAVVPIEDLELLREIEDRIDLDDARVALKEAKRKGTVSWTKIKRDLGL